MSAKAAFLACVALAAVGCVLTLSGTAASQAFCFDNPREFKPVQQAIINKPNVQCSTAFRFQWWAWALQVVSLMLLTAPLGFLCTTKAAVWGVLVSSATVNMQVANLLITQFRAAQNGMLHARLVTAFVGFVVFDLFAFLAMFAGSAYAWQSGVSGMGGLGVDSMVRRGPSEVPRRGASALARRLSTRASRVATSVPLARSAFVAAQAGAWAGFFVTLGGLGALQAACGGMTVADDPRYSPQGGSITCSRYLWFEWLEVSLALVTLLLLAASLRVAVIAPYKSAIFAVLMTAVTLPQILSIDALLNVSQATTKPLIHSRSATAFAGFVIFCTFGYLSMFAAAAYANAWHLAGHSSMARAQGKGGPGRSRARLAFGVLLLLAWAGWAICLGGLAATQAWVNTNPGLTSRILNPLLRFRWWGVALQFVCLASLCATWALPAARRFKAAVWLTLVSSVTINFYFAFLLVNLWNFTQGELSTRLKVSFSGFYVYNTFALLALFAGSAYAWELRRARAGEQPAATTEQEAPSEGGAREQA